MCIIIYKPTGEKLPTKKVLKTCYNNNPDGCGFMYVKDNKVVINKGFFSFNKFYKALKEIQQPTATPIVLHFRITTQAGVRADCCHPFPLSDNMQELRQLQTSCDIGIAHNGIISLTTDYYKKTITYNDTMKFITDYLTLIIDNKNYYKDSKKLKLIEKLSESKLAILDSNKHCQLIGSGWIKDNGCYYSNKSYLTYKVTTTKQPISSYYSEYGYGWDDLDIWDNASYYDNDYYKCFNHSTGLYEFDSVNCPLAIDGDYSYCLSCANYEKCSNDDII